MAKLGADSRSLHSVHVSFPQAFDETTFAYSKGDSLPPNSKSRLPNPLRRAGKILRIILVMLEGAQIPTNRMIRLSVIQFPKIWSPARLAPTVIMMLLMMKKAHVLKLKASASCIPQSNRDGRAL